MITPESPLYDNFTDSIWSTLQAERQPACILKAPTATSVSIAVLLARVTSCQFAAKSGGHSAFEGASNIDDGITISFELLNDTILSSDRSTVAVGPGNRWHAVYSYLADYDLTAIGGRIASIGVGGLTTGGGISYFSNVYGWACDNVASYEVVLASGRQVTATPESHPDLYWALRGGGNNFGLVVSFNLYTVPLPNNEMWASMRGYASPSFPSLAQAFYNAIVNSEDDPNAGLWVLWLKQNGTPLASTTLWYAKPNGNTSSVFAGFDDIEPLSDDTGNVRLDEFTAKLDEGNLSGLREMFYTMTVKADSELADLAKDIYFEELPATDDVQGALPIMVYQGITPGQTAPMAKRGGNALGLEDLDEPLFLIHITCWWDLGSDDQRVYAFASKVLERIEKAAEDKGKASKYLYMNYASKFQDVVASYGDANKERLMDVARTYDPKRIFQELQPGYFKLDGPPVRDSGYFIG